jgi:alcohol dehydrogenase class IV
MSLLSRLIFSLGLGLASQGFCVCNPVALSEFKFTLMRQLVLGAGGLTKLPGLVDRLGKQRALILTGNSLATKTSMIQEAERLLGKRWAGTFSGCRQHVPGETLTQAIKKAREVRADLLISIGGGSPIDTAKLVALGRYSIESGMMPHIAVPTTLSSGEFTELAGTTQKGVKKVISDPQMVPTAVIMDPTLTVHTPKELWLATGIKTLDHAIEALWSKQPNIISDGFALEAIRRIITYLPLSADPKNLEARSNCQWASWASVLGLKNVGVRLTHPFGHQMGAKWDIPHGVTSCIALPTCMRFLAPLTLDRQAKVAEALGINTTGLTPEQVAEAAAQKVEDFIDSLGLPKRLRNVGARLIDFPIVAHEVYKECREWWQGEEAEGELLDLLEKMW